MTDPMPMASKKSVPDKLAGLIVLGLFCALAVWIWVPKTEVQRTTQMQTTNDLNARLATSREKLAELIPVTSERPLFHSTRRPEAAPEAPAAPIVVEPTLTLVGILGVEGSKVALIRISTGPQLYRIEAGGRINAWDVISIGNDSVEVTKDGQTVEVLAIGE